MSGQTKNDLQDYMLDKVSKWMSCPFSPAADWPLFLHVFFFFSEENSEIFDFELNRTDMWFLNTAIAPAVGGGPSKSDSGDCGIEDGATNLLKGNEYRLNMVK